MGVVLALVSTAYFGCRSHNPEDVAKRHEKHAEWIVAKITDELDLTADQQKTLNAIKDEVIAKHAEVKDLREFAVAKFAQFHNSLTKEQKIKLKETLEKYRKYRE